MRRIAVIGMLIFAATASAREDRRHMTRDDGASWRRDIPMAILARDVGITGVELEKNQVYADLLGNVAWFNSRLLPSRGLMMTLTDAAARYVDRAAKDDHWVLSPIMEEAGELPGSESAAASWNPRTFLKGLGSIPGGLLWPWHTPSTNSVVRQWEDLAAKVYTDLGFKVALNDAHKDWGDSDTITKYAAKGDAVLQDRAETSISNGWRTLTRSILEIVGNLCLDREYWFVGHPNWKRLATPTVGIIMSSWQGETTVDYRITESNNNYYLSGEVKYSGVQTWETNNLSMFGDTIRWGTDVDSGQGPIILTGPVMSGFPPIDIVTNLANTATKGNLGETPAYVVESDDVIVGVPVGPDAMHGRFSSSWVDGFPQFEPLNFPAPLVSSSRYVEYLDANGDTHSASASVSEMAIYTPWRREYVIEDGDDAMPESQVTRGVGQFGDMSYQTPARLIQGFPPSEAREPRMHHMTGSISAGKIDVKWNNIGVKHYWYRDEDTGDAMHYLGYRINGKDYENADDVEMQEVEPDPEDPDGEEAEGDLVIMDASQILGGWVAMLPIMITADDLPRISRRIEYQIKDFGVFRATPRID